MTIIVTKEDRQAAASTVDAYRGHKDHDWQSRILLGDCDAGEMVQAFARHRIKAIDATGVVELREALELIRDTFAKDEADGYKSSSRTFALDIANQALTNTEQSK